MTRTKFSFLVLACCSTAWAQYPPYSSPSYDEVRNTGRPGNASGGEFQPGLMGGGNLDANAGSGSVAPGGLPLPGASGSNGSAYLPASGGYRAQSGTGHSANSYSNTNTVPANIRRTYGNPPPAWVQEAMGGSGVPTNDAAESARTARRPAQGFPDFNTGFDAPSNLNPTETELNGPANTVPLPGSVDEALPSSEAGEIIEPNAEEFANEPIWYEPQQWFKDEWDLTIEFGLNGSAGNADSDSFRAGMKLEREVGVHKFLFDLVHNRARTRGLSTQNNFLGKARYDRSFGESKWSMFGQSTFENDEFKAFDTRVAATVGFGYRFIKTETTKFEIDLGSGVQREIGGPDDRYVPEALFGAEFEHKLTKRQKFYTNVDYFPDWGDFTSYRIVTDAGWELLLDEAWDLNLKIGVIDRYDSTPNGVKPNDIDYSALLLWKL